MSTDTSGAESAEAAVNPEYAAMKGKDRGDKIRELYDNGEGLKRSEIAKAFGVKYQIVYQYTKPPEGERKGRGKVILPNGVARADWIREQWADGEGKSRGEILKELHEMEGQENVTYQIVFAATKAPKAAADGESSESDTAVEAVGEDEESADFYEE